MASLLLIGGILFFVVAIFFYVKLKYVKHKLHWLFLILLMVFVYISFMASIAGQGINLSTIDGLEKAGGLYLSWLGDAFNNMKSLTTHAIKMDWNIPDIF